MSKTASSHLRAAPCRIVRWGVPVITMTIISIGTKSNDVTLMAEFLSFLRIL